MAPPFVFAQPPIGAVINDQRDIEDHQPENYRLRYRETVEGKEIVYTYDQLIDGVPVDTKTIRYHVDYDTRTLLQIRGVHLSDQVKKQAKTSHKIPAEKVLEALQSQLPQDLKVHLDLNPQSIHMTKKLFAWGEHSTLTAFWEIFVPFKDKEAPNPGTEFQYYWIDPDGKVMTVLDKYKPQHEDHLLFRSGMQADKLSPRFLIYARLQKGIRQKRQS